MLEDAPGPRVGGAVEALDAIHHENELQLASAKAGAKFLLVRRGGSRIGRLDGVHLNPYLGLLRSAAVAWFVASKARSNVNRNVNRNFASAGV